MTEKSARPLMDSAPAGRQIIHHGLAAGRQEAISPDMTTGTGIAIGIAIGVAIGVAMDNIATGIGIGVAIGMALAMAERGWRGPRQ